MKLKTIIVIDNLYTGGVATSLYNFLCYAHEYLDIHLLVFNDESIDYSRIPSNIQIITPSKILHILGKTHADIKQESTFMMLYRVMMIFVARYINGVKARKLLWPFVHNVGNYDLAIAFAQDDSFRSISKGCIDYVVKKVNAHHKAVFIHCDYRNFGGYAPQQYEMYQKLDTIICVSGSCKKNFCLSFPQLENKTISIENFTNVDLIREMAGLGVEYPAGMVNFVSVCRLSKVKGLSRTIKAFGELYRSGIQDFTWTIVGGGPEYDDLTRMIDVEKLSGKIILVGNKTNPYPYIKNASFFLLPSIHEAAPMVFGESACLGVPIITTETCSAMELVHDRGIGIVVPNTYDGIKNGLEEILVNVKPSEYKPISSDRINQYATEQLVNYVCSINIY